MILLQKKQDLLRNMSIKSGIKSAEREAEQRRLRELEEKKMKAKQDCERRIIEEQKRRLELEVQTSSSLEHCVQNGTRRTRTYLEAAEYSATSESR